jgi:hypothetical protein
LDLSSSAPNRGKRQYHLGFAVQDQFFVISREKRENIKRIRGGEFFSSTIA